MRENYNETMTEEEQAFSFDKPSRAFLPPPPEPKNLDTPTIQVPNQNPTIQ